MLVLLEHVPLLPFNAPVFALERDEAIFLEPHRRVVQLLVVPVGRTHSPVVVTQGLNVREVQRDCSRRRRALHIVRVRAPSP